MAAAALTNWQNMMTEKMEKEQLVFGFESPLLLLMTGLNKNADQTFVRDPNRQRFTRAMDVGKDIYSGKKVTIPLQLSDVSSGSQAEGATFRVTAPFDTSQATYTLIDRETPIGVTVDMDRDSRNGSTSAMRATLAYIESAYRAHAKLDNDYLHGSGNGLIGMVKDATGSPGLVVPLVNSFNMDQVTPGRIVTFLTAAGGADPGNGNRRKITAVDRTAGAQTITIDTNAYASDGDSGNLTFAATTGVYVDSPTTGAAAQYGPSGLGRVVSTTDTTYGGIDKTAVAQWQGTAVAAGGVILSDDALDQATYLLRGKGVSASDFGIAHPLTVDPYKASKVSLTRYDAQQTTTIRSGIRGIIYQGADQEFPIFKDLASPRLVCRLVYLDSVRLYGDGDGPSFLNNDGTEWRFPGRAAVMEAWLYDRWQLCARDCGKNAEITGLTE